MKNDGIHNKKTKQKVNYYKLCKSKRMVHMHSENSFTFAYNSNTFVVKP